MTARIARQWGACGHAAPRRYACISPAHPSPPHQSMTQRLLPRLNSTPSLPPPQAAIIGLKEGLVDRSEGDPQLMPQDASAPWPRVNDLKAKVMRESLGAGLGGVGAAKGAKGTRARLEADGVTAR